MKLIKILFLFHAVVIMSIARDGDKLELSGYISEMPSVSWNADSNMWQGLVHNRINLNWYPTSSITGSMQLRSQIFDGDIVRLMEIENGFKKENYALPFTYHQGLGESYFVSMSIDRAWLQYSHNNFEVKLGRQRINWGQSFVWNPNDLFNSYSFFDFDYPERPGADAVRISYYPNYSSSMELAAKIDSAGKIVGAGLYRFTLWNTEFQLLGGYYSKENLDLDLSSMQHVVNEEEDIVGGFGFSGGINSLSIRGEMSYFYSLLENQDEGNLFTTSLGLDYLTPNNLGIMFEYLYQNQVNLSLATMLNSTQASQDVKSLAFTKHSFLGQFAYPITPLLNGSIAGMYFFDDNIKGLYAGPSLDYSLSDNLSLAAFFQLFAFQYEDPFTGEEKWSNLNYAFLRLKWHF